jgi:hypothetical protein
VEGDGGGNRMPSEEDLVFVNFDELMHGKLLHSCGGVLRAIWTIEGGLASIKCGRCDAAVSFNADGSCKEVTGDPLDLCSRATPQEGNA